MQKFDSQSIDNLINFVSGLNIEIHSILFGNERFSIELIRKVEELYKRKKDGLTKLNQIYLSEGFRDFLNGNTDKWYNRIDDLIVNDKKNLEELEKKVKSLSKELKQRMQQKSVLIYSKER